MHFISAETLHAVGVRVFRAAGTPERSATELVDALVEANLVGHDSHGVQYIPDYVEGIEKGWINPTAQPVTTRRDGAGAFVDGGWGFGHITARYGTEVALELARTNRIGCAAVVHCNHIGRVGRYAEIAANASCIGAFFLGRTHPPGLVAPFGGKGGALAPNVLAFGVPAGKQPAMIIDFATSAAAQSKIKVARASRKSIPRGWSVDKHGEPTTNPVDLDDGGWMLPFGGHKGYALSLLAAVLGGVATGSDSPEHAPPDPDNPWGYGGLFVICVDPYKFVDRKVYGDIIDEFLGNIRRVPPVDGIPEVLIPGDPERKERERRMTEGIPLPEDTWLKIADTASRFGVKVY